MASDATSYRFDDFQLDVANRQLTRAGSRVELVGRYFDALVLLIRERGNLVAKDAFFENVWGDVIVSDSALTQCIKEVRKQLGDSASSPRYVETVAGYGYRFIGEVQEGDALAPHATTAGRDPRAAPAPRTAPPPVDNSRPLADAAWWTAAGTAGGGCAGLIGGLLYGSVLASNPQAAGLGTASILMVLLSLSATVGLLGGFGVSAGMAAAGLTRRRKPYWTVLGGSVGGMVVGGLTKLLGLDGFTLLFGQAPVGITGALEGAALGALVVAGVLMARRLGRTASPEAPESIRLSVVGGGIGGALAGMLIPVAGGRLLGGSLELLAQSFEGSQIQLDALTQLFGEGSFGLLTQMVLAGTEGLLFGAFLAGAIGLSMRLRP